MASITSTTTGGNASATGSWVGGVSPVDGDTIIVVSGATVVQDVNRTYGNSGSAVGHGVTINGTSNVSFGTLTVNAGITLTLKGFDKTNNEAMKILQFGLFQPAAGSTIVVDNASANSSQIDNRGTINAVGTSLNPITWTVPSAKLAWNTVIASEASGSVGPHVWQEGTSIMCYSLGHGWVSNAAGTGIGSFGDTSLSFTVQSPAGILATEVASVAAVNGVGKYYVDYDLGFIFFWSTSTLNSWTAAYQCLTNNGAYAIESIQNTTYNQGIFDHCNFTGLGGLAAAADYPLNFSFKNSTTSAPNRLMQVTNCKFLYTLKAIGLQGVNGTLSDPILITGNTFTECGADTWGACPIAFTRSSNSFVNITGNTHKGRVSFIATPNVNAPIAQSNVHVDNNTINGVFVFNSDGYGCTWPDSTFNNNTLVGFQGALNGGGRAVVGFQGTSGHRATIKGNDIKRQFRGINLSSYQDVIGNHISEMSHHGINGPVGANTYATSVTIQNNLITLALADGGTIVTGYNYHHWIDGIVIAGNTLYGQGIEGGIGFGDLVDSSGVNCTTNCQVFNNLIFNSTYGVRWPANSTTFSNWPQIARLDNNLVYNAGTAYGGFSGQGTFSNANGEYNLDGARGCLGVMLWNATYSGAQTGRALVYTYTNATTRTLAWGGGTAQSVIFGNGTMSAASTQVTFDGVNTASTLTDSTQAWSTLLNNAACPSGCWIQITGGLGAGQVGRIVTNTATTLTVMTALGTALDATSTYVIIKPQVTLTDSGGTNTVTAAIDARTLPASTQTDSNITWASNPVTSNPLLANGNDGTQSVTTGFIPTASSPAKTGGRFDASLQSTDFFGTARRNPPSIGFAEVPGGGTTPFFILTQPEG